MLPTSKKMPVSKIPAPSKAKSSGIPVPRSVSSIAVTKKSQVKPPPNFSTMHHDWSEKLSRGKAVGKKPCTVVNQFNLAHAERRTSSHVARSSVRRTMVQIQPAVQRPPKRGVTATSTKKATGVTFSVPESNNFHSLVEQQRLDGVSEKFEASAASLRSILNATGVEGAIAETRPPLTHRQTIATATFKRPARIPPNFRSPFSTHHRATDQQGEARITIGPSSRQTLTPRDSIASRLAGPIAVEQRQSIYKKYIYPMTMSQQLAAQEAATATDRQSMITSQARRVRVQTPTRTPVRRRLSQSTGKKRVKWRDADHGVLVQRYSDNKDNVAVTLFQDDDVPAVVTTTQTDAKPPSEKIVLDVNDKISPMAPRFFPSPFSNRTNAPAAQASTPPAAVTDPTFDENKENAGSPTGASRAKSPIASPTSPIASHASPVLRRETPNKASAVVSHGASPIVSHASPATSHTASPMMATLMSQIAELDRKQEQLAALKDRLKRKLDSVQQQAQPTMTVSASDQSEKKGNTPQLKENVAKIELRQVEKVVSQPPVVRRHVTPSTLGFQPIAPSRSFQQTSSCSINEEKSQIEGVGPRRVPSPLACNKLQSALQHQPARGLQTLTTGDSSSPHAFSRHGHISVAPPRIRQRLSYDIDQLSGLLSACKLCDPASANSSVNELDQWIDSPDVSLGGCTTAANQTCLFEPIQRMVETRSFQPYVSGASPLARAISCLTPKRSEMDTVTEAHSPVIYSPTASLAGSAQLMLGRANENHLSFASSLAEIAVAAPLVPPSPTDVTPPRRFASPHRPQGELSLAGSLLRKRHHTATCLGVNASPSPGRRILDDEVALFACRLRLTVGALPVSRCINPIAGILQQHDSMHFVPI